MKTLPKHLFLINLKRRKCQSVFRQLCKGIYLKTMARLGRDRGKKTKHFRTKIIYIDI